jgi:hypothetical protein
MRADIRRQNNGNFCPMNTADSQTLFTPHKLTALRYRLVAGDVELTPLRVLASRTLAWNDWRVTLHILGASHAVCLQRGDICLTELLTCLPPLATQNALLTLDADTHREDCLDASGLSCRLRLQPFSLDDGDSLRHTPSETSLVQTFPTPYSLLPTPCPITRLGWRFIGDSLLIETIHTYPEEGRGLRSLTRFTPTGGL